MLFHYSLFTLRAQALAFERGTKLDISTAAEKPPKGGDVKTWQIVNRSF